MERTQKFQTIDGKFESLEKRSFLTIDDFKIKGKVLLLRVDINSSIDPETGRILDDTRIRRHSKTVEELARSEARVVILSHQSRPGRLDFVNLERHAMRMSELIDRKVRFVPDICGDMAVKAIKSMDDGDIIMLDNVRFDEQEVSLRKFNGKDFVPQANTKMVKALAPLASLFVNDAFAAAHRCQPSLVGFAEKLPAVAGRVMQRELDYLGKAINSGPSPRIAVLGGSKATDSVTISKNFLEKGVETVLTGGVVANVFLTASGVDLGKPSTDFIVENIKNHEKVIANAKQLIDKYGERIVIPSDVALNENGLRRGIPVKELPTEYAVYDIGLDTLVRYIDIIEKAGTVISNGPMGVFENPEFVAGTREIFNAMANSQGISVVGGGETTMAFNQMGLSSKVEHLSTGGGSCISFMSGETMPVLEAMRRSKETYESK
ncbi:MAG: phosphoglycerate kinase [Candidatus Thermoplasmatota archaeon]|nr:phosphoglycerate kinase [Candidatus Thermoplasmatota archaeon]MEE3242508.1 phosphoglycerate kinase [Candidatus Thermoplasmatota archaeon]